MVENREPVIRTDQEVSIAMPIDSHLLVVRQRDWARLKDDLSSASKKDGWYGGAAWAALGVASSAVLALITSMAATNLPVFAWILLWVALASGIAFSIGFGFAASADAGARSRGIESAARVVADVDAYQGKASLS